MRNLLIILILLGICTPVFPAQSTMQRNAGDNDLDKRQRERAAKFRLEYAAFKASDTYNAEAKTRLDEVNELLEKGEYKYARKLARKGYLKEYPYSKHTPYLLHAYIKSHLPVHLPEHKKHKIYAGELHLRGKDLWLRFPNYPHMRKMFMELLEAGEVVQTHGTVINIEAETIEKAVTKSWGLHLNAAINLFTFLEANGDKHVIGPRASLGLARIYLIQGTSDVRKLYMARAKYLQFLDKYPKNTNAFTALIERAYSHLIAYRGDKYDVGVLIEAAYIIKQAELYTDKQEKRIELVNKLRALIRRSHQARDYQVALWYEEKGHTTPAIYYYKEVVRRDPNSTVGKDAARALDKIERSQTAKEAVSDE